MNLTESAYNRRQALFCKMRGFVIPREEVRLYNFIMLTGQLPRITKTGRVVHLVVDKIEKE